MTQLQKTENQQLIQAVEFAPRKDLAEKLAKKLIESRFVAVNGQVGSGKSVLANKLLVEKLNENKDNTKGNREWRITYTQPGVNPIGNLIKDIEDFDQNAKYGTKAIFEKGTLLANDPDLVPEKFRNNPDMLTQLYGKAMAKNREPFNWLIIIDQSHDMFRYKRFWKNPAGASQEPDKSGLEPIFGDDVTYLNLILNASRSVKVPVHIVLVYDYRYAEYFSKYRGIPEAINNSNLYVPLASTHDIKDIIENFVEPFLIDNRIQIVAKEKELIKAKELEKDSKELEKDLKELKSNQLSYEQLKPNLLNDFNTINHTYDSALFKLQQFMKLCRELKKLPIEVYNNIKDFKIEGLNDLPPLQKTIAYYIENELKITASSKKEIFFLQALTGLDGTNQPQRRPMLKADLIKLVDRKLDDGFKQQLDKNEEGQRSNKKTPEPGGIVKKEENPGNSPDAPTGKEIFKKFYDTHFLLEDLDRNNGVIDIRYDLLLTSWPRLRYLIQQEWGFAQVYSNLVRDAINHNSSHRDDNSYEDTQSKMSKTVDKPKAEMELYAGAAYVSVIKWLKQCDPNKTWALRYFSTNGMEGSTTAIANNHNEKETPSGKNFDLARNFFGECVRDFKDQIEQKEFEVIRAKKLTNRAAIMALLSLVIGVVALFFMVNSINAKKKIEAQNLINTLDANDALNISNDIYERREKLSKIRSVGKIKRSRIYKKDDQDDKIFRFLMQGKYLNIDGGDSQDMIKCSFKALKTLKYLDNEKEITKQKKELLDQYKKLQELRTKPAAFKQFPAFYYAMSAYYWNVHDYDQRDYNVIKADALAVWKKESQKKKIYAFGSSDGKIHYFKFKDDISNPDQDSIQSKSTTEITSLDFNRDGLYFGDLWGNIRFIQSSRLEVGGLVPKEDTILLSKDSSSVRFFPFSNEPNYLLVRTSTGFLMVKNTGKGKWKDTKLNLGIVHKTNDANKWYPADSLLIVGLGKKFHIYKLYPNLNNAKKIEPLFTSKDNKESLKITSYAIQKNLQYKDDRGRTMYDVATGDEHGNITIRRVLIPKSGLAWEVEAQRRELKGVHPSLINKLEFNPGLPQLASASFDGTLKFWNLNELKNEKKLFSDNVQIRYTNSLYAMYYLDKDRLVVHTGRNHFIEPTNIEFMNTYLKNRNSAKSQR
jgi:WD40 repeat protein